MQDLIFAEQVDFYVDTVQATRAKAGTFSVADVAARLCELAGLELVDYNTVMFHPVGSRVRVELRSRAWRESWERAAQFSRGR